jgi:hypothetical protein
MGMTHLLLWLSAIPVLAGAATPPPSDCKVLLSDTGKGTWPRTLRYRLVRATHKSIGAPEGMVLEEGRIFGFPDPNFMYTFLRENLYADGLQLAQRYAMLCNGAPDVPTAEF